MPTKKTPSKNVQARVKRVAARAKADRQAQGAMKRMSAMDRLDVAINAGASITGTKPFSHRVTRAVEQKAKVKGAYTTEKRGNIKYKSGGKTKVKRK